MSADFVNEYRPIYKNLKVGKMTKDEFKIRFSIVHKLMFHVVVLLIVAVGLSTYLGVKTESRTLTDGLILMGKHLGKDIASSTKSAFWSLNWIFVEEVLNESFQDNHYGVIYAKIVKPDGEVYMANDKAYYGNKIDASLLVDQETLMENYFFQETKERGYLLVRPVNIGRERWYVILGLSLKSVNAAIRDLVFRSLTFGGLILMAGIVGSLFLSRSISRPIAKLARVAKGISAGDWRAYSVKVESRDEVGLLANAFKQMIDNLETAGTELKASEQRYRTLSSAASEAGVGIVVFQDEEDEKRLIRYTNQGMADLTGYSCEELVRKNIEDIIHQNGIIDLLKKESERGLSGRTDSTYELLSIDMRDARIPVEICYAATEFDGKKAIVCYVKDITDELKASERLRDYSENLEKMVEEKTGELKKSLKDLQETQSQLVQSEKMASIGQLAAGVAHEINNPVGFVKSNLKTMNEYREDLIRLLDYYANLEATINKESKISGNAAIHKAIEEIQKVKDEVDLDFILDDYEKVIAESLEGVARVAKIVSNLKDFSHVDKAELEHADINKGIESTINIAWNELKYKANVVKKLGDIPLIKCYPQRLNQVFMNILVNAAQAIEEKGEIRISTEADNGYVEIRISDTGSGMPPGVLSKIFDPFFTTKDVGKGTGLGLNMTYNIIQKHKGTIDVESEVGKGTTFIIRLQTEPDLVD